MVEAQGTFSEAAGHHAADLSSAGAGERLPVPQAAAVIVALSVGLWGLIGLAVSWLL